MLKDHILPLAAYLPYELRQCALEGRDTSAYAEKQRSFASEPCGPGKERLAAEILDGLAAAPMIEDYPYEEPAELEGIRAARPESHQGQCPSACQSESVLYDKIYGAWLGRCAGCLLGQPVEFWHRERLAGLLRETGNYPIRRYISSDIPAELREKYGVSDRGWSYGCSVTNWINNIGHMPEDDDINYTMLALKLLEESGSGFTCEDVALRWLMDLPALHTFTAERAAYRNLLTGQFPPASATFRNPCREWIGAQIRGDLFGYVNPGNPEAAAMMAYRDGSISHVKNGVYGEMFVAAMLSAAAAGGSAGEIVMRGLSQIPARSRLAEAVRQTLAWKEQGIGWEKAVDNIHTRYNEKDAFDSLYVVPNAMVVCIGLIFGEMDFERSVGIAVAGSFDKDCNGATVGSVVGMALGAKALPDRWIAPLNNHVKSGVDGFGLAKISDLALRTIGVIHKLGRREELT